MAAFDEVETLVQSRRLADAIYKELEQTLTRPIPVPSSLGSSLPPPLPAPPAPTLDPEELLPPPPSMPPPHLFDGAWSTTLPIAGAPAVLKRPLAPTTVTPRKKRRKARTHLHWAVLAMCIAIGVGLWRDPLARANAKRGFFAEKNRVVQVAKIAKTRVTARIVSARII